LLRLPATAAFGLALTGGLVVHGLSLIYVRRNA
jgi:hypothetical protein